jgi:DDE superfamily endonuclease
VGLKTGSDGGESRLAAYVEVITSALGHADRAAPFHSYRAGQLLPGERESIEPMAARLHPGRVQAAHQSLHHFVAKADWFDEAVLAAVRAHVLSAIERRGRIRALIIDDTAIGRWLRPPWKTCMTSRTRSSVRRAFLALPFQIRQRRRSTSGTITAFACIRAGVSVDNPLAACLACCNPMAMWNQPAIRGVLRSASEKIDRKPEAPSVNGLGLAPVPRSLAYSLVRP